MPDNLMRKRRSFSKGSMQDTVNLVGEQGYAFKDAAEAVGVSRRTLRDWHEKFAPEPEPCGDDATVEELTAEVRRLRKQLQQAELEREIHNIATAHFAKES